MAENCQGEKYPTSPFPIGSRLQQNNYRITCGAQHRAKIMPGAERNRAWELWRPGGVASQLRPQERCWASSLPAVKTEMFNCRIWAFSRVVKSVGISRLRTQISVSVSPWPFSTSTTTSFLGQIGLDLFSLCRQSPVVFLIFKGIPRTSQYYGYFWL